MYTHLDRVIARDKDTWFSIHRKIFPEDGGSPIYPGTAFQSIRAAIRMAMFWAQSGYDVYFANGAYLNPGKLYPGRKNPSANRTLPNLIGCRSLFMDIDVKPGAFASQPEAAKAVDKFICDCGLPKPTVIVASGSGGFHVYWTLSEMITVQEFRKLAGQLTSAAVAHGIHFDRQCTNDPTRLLRVADTWNFKGGGQGKPVPLVFDSVARGREPHVAIEDMRAALADYPTYVTPKSNAGRAGAAPSEFDTNDDLALPKQEYTPVTLEEAAGFCPFISETLEAHGANLVDTLSTEAVWHHVISLACHTADPHTDAHRLCSANPFYTVEGTDDKFEVAQQQRAARPGIGPPRCATLQRDGVPHCNTCPHLALNTSPLSVAFKLPPPNNPTVPGLGNPSGGINDLPDGYYRGNDNFIYMNVTNADGNQVPLIVFPYEITPFSGYIEKGDIHKMNFETQQGGKSVMKNFEGGVLADQFSLNKALANSGLPVSKDIKPTRSFMMAYLELLAKNPTTYITADPFGWSDDLNGDLGFAFAGEYVAPSGSTRCVKPDPAGTIYGVKGTVKPWQDLAAIVLTPDRPDLCVLTATAFGAPLVALSGQAGLLNGVWTAGSGQGKTTALSLGQAVWSSPQLGGVNDTLAYTLARCTMLRHLPVNYDEIKGVKQIQIMVDITLELTGSGKGRADRSGKAREKVDFVTNFNYAANEPILAAVRERSQGSDASWLRMFEMRGIKSKTLTHGVSQVGVMTQTLKANYGENGRVYADYLGKNATAIKTRLEAMQNWLFIGLGAAQAERFWIASIATTLLGAKLANELGLTNFPLHEMRAFMEKEYMHLRGELLTNSGDYNNDNTLIAAIGAYLNDKRERAMLIIDKTWAHQGRPHKNFAKVLNDYGSKQWGAIGAQISGDPTILKISDNVFGDWCTRTNRPKTAILNALRKVMGATYGNGTFGAGTDKGGSQEAMWTIKPVVGTILEPAVGEYITQYGLLP